MNNAILYALLLFSVSGVIALWVNIWIIVIKQMKADETMSLYIGNNNGTCTAYATGKKPTTNITVQATVSTVTEVTV